LGFIPPHKSLTSLDYNGNFRWQYVFGDSNNFAQPLICDKEGTIYLGDTYGAWFAAISSDGELKWQIDMHGRDVDNTCAIAEDGTLYIGIHGGNQDEFKNNLIAIRDSIITNVNDDKLVNKSVLHQNYPNPFNPSTVISWQLPVSSHIQLKVFDILGREVATIVNKNQKPGNYKFEYDGSKLSSGVYYYQIKSDKFIETKKMVILK
jgi:outer membrane protein assembly factor BamB